MIIFYANNDASNKCTSTSKRRNIQNRSFSIWKEFPTQQKAFDYLDSMTSKDLALFSFEWSSKDPGLRKFLVSGSRKDFYYEYLEIPDRHFYEVIRESTPCNLYFDLEYSKSKDCNTQLADNNDARGYEMLARFKQAVLEKLSNDFNLVPAEIKTIDMTSSSSTKFSHHLLFRIDGFMFANNHECGLFAKELLDSCGSHFQVDNKKAGEITSFCDMSVYSKNRNFRILLSSKIGKDAVLKFADKDKDRGNNVTLQAFLESLVCYFDGTPCLLPLKRLQDKQESMSSFSLQSTTSLKKSYPRAIIDCPYPEIELSLLSLIAEKTRTTPRISSFIEYKESDTILYSITGSRYCDIVKREHASNGQFYIVDLNKGTAVQKCFDPDCKGYSSAPISLPAHLFKQGQETGPLDDFEDADLFADIPDEALLQINFL